MSGPYAALDPHAPSTSWWCDISRADLAAAVQQQRTRMAWTRFGRMQSAGVSASDDPALKGRQQGREAVE